MKYEELLKLPEAQELQSLEEREQQLRSMLDAPDLLSEVRPGYESALRQLEERKIIKASSEILQSHYAQYGIEGAKGLEQIRPLEDLLPEEELEVMRTEFRARVMTAKDFFELYGTHTDQAIEFIRLSGAGLAVATTTEVIPVAAPTRLVASELSSEPESAPTEPTQPEARESEPTTVEVLLGKQSVFLGKQKRMVPLSKRHYEAQTDYSDVRRKAFQILIENQGGEIKANDLWNQLYPDGRPLERNTMSSVRAWLLELSYSRKHLVLFNGKRGTAASYRISPDFNLALVEATQQRKQPEIDKPVEVADMFVAARHLEQFNFVLRQKGCSEVDSKIVNDLEQFRPDYHHIKGNAEAIRQSRIDAIARIEKFINDQERMYRFVEATDAKRADFRFVEYLFGLEEDQLELIKRLITCRVERVPINGGRFRIEAVDENDRVIAWSDPFAKTASELSETPEREERIEPEQHDEKPSEEPALKTISNDNGESNEVATQTPKTERKKADDGNGKFSESELAKLSLLETVVLDTAMTLLEHLSPGESYTRPHIQNFLPKFSANRVATAKDNHVVPKEKHKKFTIEEAIKVVLYTHRDLQNIYTNRKYKRVVEDIIQRAFKKAIEASERALVIKT